MSLRSLAALMGCSINTLRWHEKGARCLRADELQKMAELIGVQPADLIGENPITQD